jgi:flagellar protein FlaI
MNSYLLEEVIAFKMGLPPTRRREVYAELDRRAEYLRSLKEQGVTTFKDVYKVLSKAYREGVL